MKIKFKKGRWHSDFDIFDGRRLLLSSQNGFSGCGVYHVKGWGGNTPEVDYKKLLDLIKSNLNKRFISTDVDMICTQAGKLYYSHPFIKELERRGATYIEYPNNRHLGNSQRLYVWIPSKDK